MMNTVRAVGDGCRGQAATETGKGSSGRACFKAPSDHGGPAIHGQLAYRVGVILQCSLQAIQNKVRGR